MSSRRRRLILLVPSFHCSIRPGLAQHPEMVGAGRFGDLRGEAAARPRLSLGASSATIPRPLRIAQRVQDRGEVEVDRDRGVQRSSARNDTTIIELCGTVIIEL